MLLDSPHVERLIEAFRRLPGIGRRSAERMALHLLSGPAEEAAALSSAILDARRHITKCPICGVLSETEPCSVCSDERRDRSTICVVEQTSGAMAIEKGRAYNGLYHVLNGVLSPLEGIGPNELHLDRLFKRLENGEIKEVILATNTTAEGEATALYLSRQIAQLPIQVSRIAHGVPMGGGLELADEATLSHALEGRTRMQS